jgi:serine/threonine protein phosphatase PrpC
MAMPDYEEDRVELISGERFAEKFFAPTSHRLQIKFGAASHPGNVRPDNEDHYAVVKRRRTSELLLTNLSRDDLVLADDSAFALVVADGMGGARFGEFASRLALQTMFELAQQATSWVTKYTDLEVQQIRERVEAYVQRIQATLREYIEADPALAGMGTTWTSAHLLLPHALVVHIGDSRAYLLHDGELHQVTRDETLAQVYIDSGMDPDSVKKFRHLLLNNLGGDTDDVTAQIHHIQIEPGDRLLLCTDGLTDMVADEDIALILQRTPTPQTACDELVSAALNHGGKDNVTVVLASAVSEAFR